MKEIFRDLLRDLINPVALAWIFLFFAALICWAKRKRGLARVLIGIWFALWIFGTLPIGSKLLNTLEGPYKGLIVSEIPECEAIVVLGGAWSTSQNDLVGFNATFAADRFLTGFELLRKGKSNVVLIGGGGAEIKEDQPGDSAAMAEWMQSFGLEDVEIVALPACHNTRDEALKVREFLDEHGGGRVLLVTSAWHMRRAEGVFKKVGLEIFPVPCDFEIASLVESGKKKWNLVPRLEQFVFMDLFLHEWVGFHYYKFKGWVD